MLSVAWLLVALQFGASGMANDSVKVESGVSRELARQRAAIISDLRYHLSLRLEPGVKRIKGRSDIRLRLSQITDQVVLDFRDLDDNAKPVDAVIHGAQINGQQVAELRQLNGHILLPGRYFKRGENRLTVSFETSVAASGRPITRYIDHDDGSEYVYTLFVPMDASLAIPCFDQPDLKARLKLEISAPDTWKVISNSPVERASKESQDNFRRTTFSETPPISTYLFAFAAGPFEEMPGAVAPVPIRLLVRRSKISQARNEWPEVERLTREGTRHLIDFFAQPFPFAKYDQVLIPGFSYGGMEHAGATFLREDAILFRSSPTKGDKLSRASLVLHELSHQWFGDFLTMRWFDDLWLKEGFANYMASHTMAALFPPELIWKRFYEVHKPPAYAIDATLGTTPIYQEVRNLADAKSAYGAIVYQKAPSLLRALSFVIGDKSFRDGVRLFLKQNAYGNAEWSDLIRSFERTSGQELESWASAWVRQRGMPQVEIECVCNAAGKVGRLTLSQKDVLNEGGSWPIKTRLLLAYDDAPAEHLTVAFDSRTSEVVDAVGKRCPSFIFGNDGDYGYGRFLLDARSRASITTRLTNIKDTFLKGMLWGALWESVREVEMSGVEYISLGLRALPHEKDEELARSILTRMAIIYHRYLSPTQRSELAPEIERLCLDGMQHAEELGLRIGFFRAFRSLATSEAAREKLKETLSGRLTVPGMELRPFDRWQIIRVLVTLSDVDSERLLAEERRLDSSDEGRKQAYIAEAARGDQRTKQLYFTDFLQNRKTPEDWIEGSLPAFNSWNQADVTIDFLKPALDALPQIKRERKIFFVLAWLNAFIGGQQSAEALATVRAALAKNDLDRDLRLKVLEVVDELERTVRIRAKKF